MKQSRYLEEQIIGILKEHDAGVKTVDLFRRHGMSPATFYNWKSRLGGMEVSGAKRLRALEGENAKHQASNKKSTYRKIPKVFFYLVAGPD